MTVMPANTTYTVTCGRRGLCVNSYSDLAERSAAASAGYCAADDGGYPGTAASRTYRAEQDAVWAECARRNFALLAAAFGMPA